MRVILIGDDSLLLPCAEMIRAEGGHIVAVVTEDATIRGWANDLSLPVHSVSPGLATELGRYQYDWLLSITNLRVLPAAVLATAGRGAVNFHDGPLPRYGGLNAPAWALLAGEPVFGISWHLMTEAVDAGEVLVSRDVLIDPSDTSVSLNVKCFEAAIASFPELLTRLRQPVVTGTARPLDRTTWHGKSDRPSGLGVLNPALPADTLARMVRALDFGKYPNPLTLPKLVSESETALVRRAHAVTEGSSRPLGSLVADSEGRLQLATSDGALVLDEVTTVMGVPLAAGDVVHHLGLEPTSQLPELTRELLQEVDATATATAPYEDAWIRRLATLAGPELPVAAPAQETPTLRFDVPAAPGIAPADLVARFAILVARLAGAACFDLQYAEAGRVGAQPELARWFSPWVPLRVEFSESATVAQALESVRNEQERVRKWRGFARDLWSRRGEVGSRAETRLAAAVWVTDHPESRAPFTSGLLLSVSPAGGTLEVMPGAVPPEVATTIAALLASAAAWEHPDTRWASLSLVSRAEQEQLLEEWGRTEQELTGPAVVHRWFEAQVERTPEAVAVIYESDSLSYRELNTRANRLARHLTTLGVGQDVLVALICDRSVELVVAILAIHKAGGAYVPIDPAYPAPRVALMLEDSQAPVLITQESVLGDLPPLRATTFCIDRDWDMVANQAGDNLPETATPQSLAYCIYTSGSTGRPKAVMVEHRNVQNFFAAMDDRLGTDPGVWLAVTSLSFDISVLELLWTLGRGYTVVIQGDDRRGEVSSTPAVNADRGIDFSLFYFSADEGSVAGDRYQLLLEGARYADANGFTAVWTPERHFHAFGGLYPNPAVTGAAVAAITSRIGIRAGSCVLPLHHPARVAEEWAVVDNLSGGRVGISFASGWQPDDFIFHPENYADAKAKMVTAMDQVKRLWRGEALTFDGPRGPVTVQTRPRPLQPNLPVWFTTAGNPESYELAGRLGVNVLTHLLGQSVDELADKITAYRRAWRAADHAGEGAVALMLHAFLGENDATVKELVRAPMKNYLGTSVNLIKGYAAAFPTFRKPAEGEADTLDFKSLTAEEMDALLEFSFERYYETSGLFGTVESGAAFIDRLKGIGVNEVACLVDFGVAPELVLTHLRYLNRLRLRTSRPRPERADYSLPAQIVRHRVTHLQCTPSFARMLLADDRSREALRRLTVMCVGGEALPVDLARALRRLVPGDLWNMYGPTETTVWSTMHRVGEETGSVPLGRPLANTLIRVLDRQGNLVPHGVPGELHIGGLGVTRGYLRRPERTEESFYLDRFGGGRFYRTGDLVRWRQDGGLEFLGRTDFQVKIRGHRIELGEIEACLLTHPQVKDAAVIAREVAPGDQRLVAYVVTRGESVATSVLREYLSERLPQAMWPSAIVFLPALPLTPNRKVDRTALPTPEPPAPAPAARTVTTGPAGKIEEAIAAAWREALGTEQVGLDDNFFDLGGHSLLAVRVHARLRQDISGQIAIVDLFRFPTIRALGAHLSGARDEGAAVAAQDRAQARRASLQRRMARRGAE